jgi:hypothetical protein
LPSSSPRSSPCHGCRRRAPSPAKPQGSFVDNAGLVSRDYAWKTSGYLGNDPLLQMVFYTDVRPPPFGAA